MDNLTTVALVVLFCSIVVFFSQEFTNLFKKIFAIPGVKLFLPLVLVTALVVYYSSWLFLGALSIQHLLLALSEALTQLLSFKNANYLVNIVLLMSFSFLPVWLINIWVKRQSYEPFQYAFLLNTILWLIVALLITIG